MFFLGGRVNEKGSRSQVKTEEMSFQVSLENCQGLSILDRGGKFIPPARSGEWKIFWKDDFVPLCDGNHGRRSLADLRLLEGM